MGRRRFVKKGEEGLALNSGIFLYFSEPLGLFKLITLARIYVDNC